MRALWFVRSNLDDHPGGDTVQIHRTAAAARARGWTVDFTTDPSASFEDCDVVHLFHLDRLWEHLAICRRLNAERTPAVLSTIYWPADMFDRGGRQGVQGTLAWLFGSETYRSLRLVQRWALDAIQIRSLARWDPRLLRFAAAARELLSAVSIILPNSQAEADIIYRQFKLRPETVIVPNAADAADFAAGEAESESRRRERVLCVGRIEPRKNQLALLEALRDTDISVTLVGRAGRFNQAYARRCRAVANAHTIFIDHQTPAELCKLYHTARVHACVSWYETPGLASLEAGLAGCRLVVTPGGSTREYFGDDAHYCQPGDPISIRAAIEAALAAPPDTRLADRIRREFTWQAAAERTIEAYEMAMSAARGGDRKATPR